MDYWMDLLDTKRKFLRELKQTMFVAYGASIVLIGAEVAMFIQGAYYAIPALFLALIWDLFFAIPALRNTIIKVRRSIEELEERI